MSPFACLHAQRLKFYLKHKNCFIPRPGSFNWENVAHSVRTLPPPFHPLTPRSTPSSPVNPYLPPSLIKNQIIWSNCLTTIPPSTSPPFLVRSEQYQNSEVSLCLTTHKYINVTHTNTHTHTHSLTHQFNSAKVTGRSLGLNWPDMEEAQSNHQLRPNHTFISPAHNTAII